MARRQKTTAATPSLFGEDRALPPPEGQLFAAVALNRPVRREFTYTVERELASRVLPGARVAVPFGPRRHVGVVVGVSEHSEVPTGKLRGILAVLDEEPVVDEELLGLTRWISERYACAWGEALAAVLPAPLKRESKTRRIALISAAEHVGEEELEELTERFPKQHRLLRTLRELEAPIELRDILRQLNLSESPARSLERRGWVRIEKVEALADALLSSGRGRSRPGVLSPDQTLAVARLKAAIEERRSGAFLLHGVTGSGKTEVYLHAIEAALSRGRSAIALVPEIALTPQTVSWFQSRFGEVCVLHSRMTEGQRFAAWKRLQRGEIRVVVGARSAVFAPVRDLGVIVVDEEHEPSFKQESVPRYHAREVAIERARRSDAICVLGSATPSLESWNRVRLGEYKRLSLPTRVGGGVLPSIHVVDMRIESERGKGAPLFSRLLTQLLSETLAAGEQALLFLNRRGFIPVLYCPGCKTSATCGQCDMSLTYHRRIHRLVCHSCCEEILVPEACPTCSRPGLRFIGVGSERVEAELKKSLPDTRVSRMDSDTMRRREDYEETLGAFERHELDILVGTQMIAKGLDFPRVTLVGVVSADQALHLPDFRAAERTFQLIAQVAGRAGRAELPGRIVVQTSAPDHFAIQKAAQNDYEGFATEESLQREELGYPPHGRIVRAVFEDRAEERAAEAADEVARRMRAEFQHSRLEILGPAPAPFALLRGFHRRHLLVKAPLDAPEFETAVNWLADRAAEARVRLKVDVDPMAML